MEKRLLQALWYLLMVSLPAILGTIVIYARTEHLVRNSDFWIIKQEYFYPENSGATFAVMFLLVFLFMNAVVAVIWLTSRLRARG